MTKSIAKQEKVNSNLKRGHREMDILDAKGWKISYINEWQFRVEDKFDFYFVNMRFHDIKNDWRGDFTWLEMESLLREHGVRKSGRASWFRYLCLIFSK